MAKFRAHKNSLIGGEISPTAFGRVDLPQYGHACKTLKNVIPFLSGGAYRRPGTYWEDSVPATTDYVPRLIPFRVSKSESYALLFGAPFSGSKYIRAYRAPSNAGQSTTGTLTYNFNPPWKGRVVADAASWGYYDEFQDIQFAQSADTMWLTHPRYKPMKLIRTARDAFTLSNFDTSTTGAALTGTSRRDAYPYLPQNTTATTLAISNTAIGINRTLTASTGIFNALHVGGVFKHDNAGTVGMCLVTAFVSATQLTVDVIQTYGATTAVTTWWEGAWSDYRGWPRSVALYQGRLIYGGTVYKPDTLWFSRLNNYTEMSTSSDADPYVPASGTSGYVFTLASEQLNLIQWLSSEKTLVTGTQADEWVIEPTDSALAIAGGNTTATRQSSYGSAFTQVVRKGDEILFAMASETEIRGLVFNDLQKSYTAEPVQLLYDEFPRAEPSGSSLGNRKIKSFQWDESRKTLWCIDTAGNLVGMTRDRQSGVTAWHSHELGGFDADRVGAAIDTGGAAYTTDPAYIDCAGSVLSVAVVPNPFIGTNDVWLVVKRYINSAFTYHVERMIGRNYPFASAYQLPNPEGSYLVDAAVYVANLAAAPTIVADVFSDLDHLEGETPVGTAYNTRGIFKVSGGAISSGDSLLSSTGAFGLDTEVTTVVVMGLPYDSVIEPVRIEAGSQIGSSQSAIKRLHEVTPRFYRTIGCKLGRDADTLETLIFREASTLSGNSAELFTGDKPRKFNGTYDRDGLIYILQDQPLPFAVVSVTAEGLEYDGG